MTAIEVIKIIDNELYQVFNERGLSFLQLNTTNFARLFQGVNVGLSSKDMAWWRSRFQKYREKTTEDFEYLKLYKEIPYYV